MILVFLVSLLKPYIVLQGLITQNAEYIKQHESCEEIIKLSLKPWYKKQEQNAVRENIIFSSQHTSKDDITII